MVGTRAGNLAARVAVTPLEQGPAGPANGDRLLDPGALWRTAATDTMARTVCDG